ncbi:multidrug resistance protein SMR [Paenibacillus sp. BIHB 4019]|uniref:Multidrug resistance protein SMR n=1 Tax=Paenibacillus sp. BIHB 4019 TaxID=1870819 RepID=A0A1B2DR89_9BACL|nr:multidrug efflux SMR transporter [Paenibacillus sp. BIHB 4019]ANY70229.1 multidrug resistance protein SMR [Paenibacillus sp. BIHB 4019]
MNRGWLFVLLGSLFEVLWVMGLKHSHDALTWIGTVLAIVLSFYLLMRAIALHLPVGTVYAVFTGLGTTGTVLVEMLVFGEAFNIVKVALILVLLAGVVGLKAVTKAPQQKGGAA